MTQLLWSLQGSAHDQKEAALQLFQQHNYEEALKLFKLALLLHPEDSSALKFRRSVESHQAAAYFKLRQYRKALEVGETSYRSNSSLKSTVRSRIRQLNKKYSSGTDPPISYLDHPRCLDKLNRVWWDYKEPKTTLMFTLGRKTIKGRSEQGVFLAFFLDPVFVDRHVWCFESQTIDPGQSKDEAGKFHFFLENSWSVCW